MSDISIPGVKSRFETEKLIEGLMKLERVPKERAEKNVEDLGEQKSAWQDVGRRTTALRESARTLFSFQNPFNERVGVSEDETVVAATATREAVEQERTFLVKAAATSDKFLSSPQEGAFKVPAGEYAFSVGKDEVSVKFRGGSLKDFAEAVTARGKDKVRASTLTVRPGTTSLVLEAVPTGAENRLGFKGPAEELALSLGMVRRVDDGERRIDLAAWTPRTPAGTAAGPRVAVEAGALRAGAGSEARVPFSPPVAVGGNLTLEFEYRSASFEERAAPEDLPPSGPTLPLPGAATYGGVTVENDPSSVPLPDWKPPAKPPRVDDLSVLRLAFSDGTTAALPPRADGDFEKVSVRLADYGAGKQLVGLDAVNRNTHRDVELRGVRVFDPEASGGLKPREPVSVAGDALVVMDGIEISRPKNEIDDLIPGVTVSVRGASEKKVKLRIEPDREAAKEAVIAVVGNYNRLLAEINVLTRADDKIVEELAYLEKDEQEAMKKKSGLMQGDSTLNQLKAMLQRSASSAFPTSAEREMALLSQIGVSTDARRGGSGSGLDVSRLRGYLEIDEKALDKALRDRLPAVKELFGNDTDGDRVIDSGFAFSVDSVAKSFVETGGIVALKTGTIDTRIDQEKKRIEALDKQIAAKEDDLKRKYGMMEGALGRMERTSSSIDQFSKRSSE